MSHNELKTARRWARKKETKEKPRRTETAQSGLLTGIIPGKRQPSAWHWCQARECQLDTAVCIVHQTRDPRKCEGCGHFKKG